LSESGRTTAIERFHQISEAYSALADPKEKVKYDKEYDGKFINTDDFVV